MITFHFEKFSTVYDEAKPLLVKHWKEICKSPERMPLNPDLDTYNALDAQGKLITVTARDDNELIGYIVFIVAPHLHYKDVMVGNEDIHFLAPEYRKGTTGIKLLKAGEEAMRLAGADLVILRTKAKQNHGKIFTRLGYDETDHVYIKFLKV